MKKILCATVLAALAFGAEGFKVITKYKIGGEGRWDYVAVDSDARRLYVSHSTSVEVLDADTGKLLHTIGQLHGVHGIALAPDLNKGFITNGQSSSVTAFDLKTLEKTGEPAVGKNPDAICYEPKTKRRDRGQPLRHGRQHHRRQDHGTCQNRSHWTDRRVLRGGRRRQGLRQPGVPG